jgi:SOS response associated peptidase (SRAP)
VADELDVPRHAGGGRRARRRARPVDGALVVFASETGLRPQEGQALERGDWLRDENVIVVSRAFADGNVKPYGKSSGSRRRVPLFPRAEQALRSLPARLDTRLLFPAAEGGVVDLAKFQSSALPHSSWKITWDSLRCTIVTTRPNQLVAEAHDRMPVILPRNAEDEWLVPACPSSMPSRCSSRTHPARCAPSPSSRSSTTSRTTDRNSSRPCDRVETRCDRSSGVRLALRISNSA